MSCFLLCLFVQLQPPYVGGDAFARLGIVAGARELAMAGAVTASCNSAAAAFCNPAGLAAAGDFTVAAFGEPRPLGLFHVDGDGRAAVAAGKDLSGMFTLGLAVDHFNLAGIPVREREGPPEDSISYSETMSTLCLATEFAGGVFIGSGLVFYGQSFTDPDYPMASFGVSGTFGTVVAPHRDWKLGLSVRLPARLCWSGTSDSVHTRDKVSSRAAFGCAWQPAPKPGLLVEMDVATRFNRQYTLNLGGEWSQPLVPVEVEGPDAPVSFALRAGVRDVPLGGSPVRPGVDLSVGAGLGFRLTRAVRLGLDGVGSVSPGAFGANYALGLTVGSGE